MSDITIVSPGPLTTVQDAGRAGYAHQGVPRSGYADPVAATLANRLVGNSEDAALLETTLGGLEIRCAAPSLIAVTGAPVRVEVAGRAVGMSFACRVPAGATVRLGAPASGLRSYVAVRGGLAGPGAAPVLGSWSADLLSGLSRPLAAADRLRIGIPAAHVPGVDLAPVWDPPAGTVVLEAHLGPRADRFVRAADVFAGTWETSPTSNRIGVRLDRLDGPPLVASGAEQLPSEGMALGAVQVPPGGQPVIFGPDHPVTGGYPVIAVLTPRSLAAAFQLRPGQRVRLRPAR